MGGERLKCKIKNACDTILALKQKKQHHMQKIKSIEISPKQVEDLRARLEVHALEENDYTLLDAFVQSHFLFQEALQEKNITISKLRSVFGKKTEKIKEKHPEPKGKGEEEEKKKWTSQRD